jgi:antibiotic biosynthesis monooxygenase (ABM) superfamily enzyme
MIKHIVSFKLKDEAAGRNKAENAILLKNALMGLLGKVPTLKSMEVGINSEKAPQDNFEVVLISTFDNWAGLDAYQTHPEHLKVVELVKQIRESRSCVDFEY